MLDPQDLVDGLGVVLLEVQVPLRLDVRSYKYQQTLAPLVLVLSQLLNEAVVSLFELNGPALFQVVEHDGLLLVPLQLLDPLVALVNLVLLPLALVQSVFFDLSIAREVAALSLVLVQKCVEAPLGLLELLVDLAANLLLLSSVELDGGVLGFSGFRLGEIVSQLVDLQIHLGQARLQPVSLLRHFLVATILSKR